MKKSVIFLLSSASLFCILVWVSPAQAVPKKQRLVLMPLQMASVDVDLLVSMESALVEGLKGRYRVFSGEQVRKKVKEEFAKESKAAKSCDETKCIQDIAFAFQSELVAVANVTKRTGEYLLSLSIRNVVDHEVVDSKSLPCENCNEIRVVAQLKLLAGGGQRSSSAGTNSSPATSNAPAISSGSSGVSFNLGEMDSQTKAQDAVEAKWNKYLIAMKQAYGQVVAYEQGDISQALKTQAWENYLRTYKEDDPYSTEDDVLRTQAELRITVELGDFRDCTDCPEMVRLPGINITMGKYEVTQAQWRSVMGNNPSYFTLCGDDCPVEQVSWDDVQVFINKLNQRTGQHYRLPTEAEWEKACSAGKSADYCGSDKADDVAWSTRNSQNITHPVGQKRPNAWGLYDMSGNVWEWTETGDDSQRVIRGGSWINKPGDVRAAIRDRSTSDFRYNYVLGFRLARDL